MEFQVHSQLFEAAEKGNIAFISKFLPLATTITNSKKETLLHYAAGYGNINLASYLIAKGSDVNAQDLIGQAPLHNACCHRHLRVSKKLIDQGAEVNLSDNNGWSPLHFALARKENSKGLSPRFKQLVELLIISGADLYSKSKSGRNCLNRIKNADEKKHFALLYWKHLLEGSEKFDFEELKTRDNFENRTEIIDKYLSVKYYFDIIKEGDKNLVRLKQLTTPEMIRSKLETSNSITPLHQSAAFCDNLEIAKFLVSNGADVNARDMVGLTPLQYAAKYQHIDMIEFLVLRGADVNTRDCDGCSPLHVAAEQETYQVCLALLRLGADKSLKCDKGIIPYDLAKFDDVKEVLKLPTKAIITPAANDLAIYVDLPSNSESPHPPTYSTALDPLMMDSNSNEPLFNSSNHEIKKITLQESDYRYLEIKRRMTNSIMTHDSDACGHFNTYEILDIEMILNQKVWTNYKLTCQILKNKYGCKNEKLLFHGSMSIDVIQINGFDEKFAQKDGMFGSGIYFAKHSSKSNQYAFGFGNGCQEHSDKSCRICKRKLVYSQVALGKSLVCKQAIPDCAHGPPGYSSVTGLPGQTDDLLYEEYVIYNGSQAYPLFVITYRIK